MRVKRIGGMMKRGGNPIISPHEHVTMTNVSINSDLKSCVTVVEFNLNKTHDNFRQDVFNTDLIHAN